MSKRIKYPNGVIYIEGKLSSHEEDQLYKQMTPKRILRSKPKDKSKKLKN
jgi:hypothetical protein